MTMANLGDGVSEFKINDLHNPSCVLYQQVTARNEHLLLGFHHTDFQDGKIIGCFITVNKDNWCLLFQTDHNLWRHCSQFAILNNLVNLLVDLST